MWNVWISLFVKTLLHYSFWYSEVRPVCIVVGSFNTNLSFFPLFLNFNFKLKTINVIHSIFSHHVFRFLYWMICMKRNGQVTSLTGSWSSSPQACTSLSWYILKQTAGVRDWWNSISKFIRKVFTKVLQVSGRIIFQYIFCSLLVIKIMHV